ncbi:MAG: Gfo/Idh/MocA family oxidoreductase [Anaerolineaceae bacterium]|nr:Gfo/Idh/MocA family oxidoreductase [Anaerolineaceae bacterium]
MKILIAGYGSIGRRHLRNLLALGERDIVLLRSNRSTLPEDEIAQFPLETDLAAALDHRPDAVIISNPTALHLDVAIPAAEAGCAILLEKPVSHSMQRVDQFRAAVQRGGARVLVGFQFRFHPMLHRAVQLLKEGAIGQPLSIRVQWGEYLPNWHPWEDFRQGYAARADLGGGVILTLCHPFDYVRMLLGDLSALWAFTSGGALGLPVEDNAEIGLQFASGAIGSVHLDYLQQPGTHIFEIVGSSGTLRWNNADALLSIYRPDRGGWQNELPPDGFERNWLFMEEMRNFLAVARGEAEPACTLEDGICALQIALLARESAADGLIKRIG